MVLPHSEPKQADLFSLGTLIAQTGVPASTIHYYRRAGLLPPPRQMGANHFIYDQRHVDALRAIRLLRERRGVPLDRIAELLPSLLAEHGDAFHSEMWAEVAGGQLPGVVTVSRRLVDAAIELFRNDGYAEVTVSQIADLAGVAKGSVYRHFDSKDALFTAAIRTIVAEVATEFEAAMNEAGEHGSLQPDRGKAAAIFADVIDPSMPILLELGARAAQGDQASLQLALWTLRMLAETAGRGQAQHSREPADAIAAGLGVIGTAFAGIIQAAIEAAEAPDA
jgi:AcrR family transcriptional regulator